MIDPESLCRIGILTKTHGLKGEVVCQYDDPSWAAAVGDHLLLLLDGIPTPFFIGGRRERSSVSHILLLDDVQSAEEAAELVGSEVLLERSALAPSEEDEEPPTLRYFIGFTIVDARGKTVGKVVEVDDQTANLLFAVETADRKEVLIPAHPDLIVGIDHQAGIITMQLPEGLI